MKRLSPISLIASVLGVSCIAYYLLCGIAESFSTSGLWIWLAFGMILASGVLWKIFAEPKIARSNLHRIYRIVKNACLSMVAVFLAIFFVFEGFVIVKWIEGTDNSEKSADTIIILGAAVEYDHPDETLQERIDTAYEFIKKNPDSTVIACGGLGEGDIITEAECIKRELITMGIDPGRIYTESRSTSTAENFRFSASLLKGSEKNIAVVSSGFHQFRAITAGEYIFEELGIFADLIPVSASCTSVKLPANMVREFAAFTKSYLSGDIGF